MLSNYHHIARSGKEIAHWPDISLLEVYNNESIYNATVYWRGPRFVNSQAHINEMDSRGSDKLNYKITNMGDSQTQNSR
jgi:hypothetical protein